MIDLHSHIIFAVDDGARDVEEAVEMASEALKIGYSKILCTPHFRYPNFINQKNQEHFAILRKELERRKIDIELLIGNELYLEPENIKALKEGQVKAMGNSRYILVEASPSMPYRSYLGALKKVEELGYMPVLAHLERYFFSLQEIKKLHERYPVQVNISSANLEMKKQIKILTQEKLIDILATDSHRRDRRNYKLSEEMEIFKKLLGKERFELVTKTNPERILRDEEIIKNRAEGEKVVTGDVRGSLFSRIFRYFKKLSKI